MTDRTGIAVAALLVILGGAVVGGLNEACTKAQETQVLTTTETVLTDLEKACVVLEVADAAYPVTVPYVLGACQLDATLAGAVQDYLPTATTAATALKARRIEAYRKAHRDGGW